MLDLAFDVLLWFLPRKVHWVIVALIIFSGCSPSGSQSCFSTG